MSRAYQQAFDALFQFTQDIPGAKLSERTFEWESGGGNHRQVHRNHMITVEANLAGRPYMLIHQDDPPDPDQAGLEIFLSAMSVPADLKIRPRSFWSFIKPGQIKVAAPGLAQFLFTAPREYRAQALALANKAELEIPLTSVPWDQVRLIDFQDGSGVSMRFPAAAVLTVSPVWLAEHAQILFDMLVAF